MILLPQTTIAAAVAAQLSGVQYFQGALNSILTLQATFAYGAGGTTTKAWVQTTFDGGATWMDIANFAFTTAAGKRLFNLIRGAAVTSIATPTDGTLADNTVVNGFIGPALRVKYTTTGTYTGATNLTIWGSPG